MVWLSELALLLLFKCSEKGRVSMKEKVRTGRYVKTEENVLLHLFYYQFYQELCVKPFKIIMYTQLQRWKCGLFFCKKNFL